MCPVQLQLLYKHGPSQNQNLPPQIITSQIQEKCVKQYIIYYRVRIPSQVLLISPGLMSVRIALRGEAALVSIKKSLALCATVGHYTDKISGWVNPSLPPWATTRMPTQCGYLPAFHKNRFTPHAPQIDQNSPATNVSAT